MKVKSLDRPTPITKIHDSPLFEEIQGCEFPRKFSSPTFNYYSNVSVQFNTSDPSGTRWWSTPAMI